MTCQRWSKSEPLCERSDRNESCGCLAAASKKNCEDHKITRKYNTAQITVITQKKATIPTKPHFVLMISPNPRRAYVPSFFYSNFDNQKLNSWETAKHSPNLLRRMPVQFVVRGSRVSDCSFHIQFPSMMRPGS